MQRHLFVKIAIQLHIRITIAMIRGSDQTQAIELQRLELLQQQAALHGPNTPPAVLIELQALEHKYKRRKPRSAEVQRTEYDFLMNTVSAALQRITGIEAKQDKDAKERIDRQTSNDRRQTAIMVLIVVILMLQLVILF